MTGATSGKRPPFQCMHQQKRRLRLGLKIIITIVLLYLLLHKVKISNLYVAFSAADFRLIPLVLLMSLLMILLRSYKWYFLLRLKLEGVSYREAFVSFLGGMGLGVVTPARVGEVSRIFFLRTKDKFKAGALVILDRLFDLMTVFLFGTLGAIMVSEFTLAFLALLVTVPAFFIVSRPDLFYKGARWMLGKDLLPEPVTGLKSQSMAFMLLLAGLNFILDLASFYVLIYCFQPSAFRPIAFSFPIILLTNLLPITIGGIGVREGTSMLLLAKFGIPAAVAANASFLLYVFNTLIPGAIGAIFFVRKSRLG